MNTQTDNQAEMTSIHLSKEDMKFSAAHFTVFSQNERERVHGHNFRVAIEITAPVSSNGMAVSYKELKKIARECCHQLDEYVLLPENSPFLKIKETDTQYEVIFDNETLYFPRSDTLLLPIRNATVEELSHYLLSNMLNAYEEQLALDIDQLTVRVSSGAGQSGSSQWHKDRPSH